MPYSLALELIAIITTYYKLLNEWRCKRQGGL